MLELLKIQRLIDLKNQSNELKSQALESMQTGDLKAYFEKITRVNKINAEFTETLHIKS